VALAVHVSATFDVPTPESVGATLFILLANVIVPDAAPGEPEAGANVTLACAL